MFLVYYRDFVVGKASLIKSGLYALASIFLLTYYGIEVCPFLEQLTPAELGGALTVALACSFVLKILIFRYLDRKEAATHREVNTQKPWRYLLIDLSAWALAGLLVTIWNTLRYDFPVPSGLKVVLGTITLGIFSATAFALDEERDLIVKIAETENLEGVRTGRFLSVSTKFLVFISTSLVVITGIILLLIYKDFDYVIHALSHDAPFQFSWIVKEILFVFGVLLLGSLMVARHYSRNLRLMFDLQLKTFGAVERGNYDTFVPVVSHDEFSLIAEGANRMIVGLREKERIKRALGKYMSPTVAQAVLSNEHETRLGGRLVDVAVLFTDMRNFTPLSEHAAPQEIVDILNAYFGMVVKAVHQRQGVLDKFMGDAAMAVFGLGGCDDPCEAALGTAFDIQKGLGALNDNLQERGLSQINTGIGIHFGPVVAGNIGSEERMEYTVIGDTVNTASRLEGLTKEFPSSIAVSQDVYKRVAAERQRRLVYLGASGLKGKSEKLPVYGLATA